MRRTASETSAETRRRHDERCDSQAERVTSGPGSVSAIHRAAGNQAVKSRVAVDDGEARADRRGDVDAGNDDSGAVGKPDSGTGEPRGGTVGTASAATVRRKLRRDDVEVVDVRSPSAFSEGHVPGATNVPVPAVDRHADQFRDASEVVAYCQSGRRSRQATRVMRASFGADTQVRDFTGGMRAWRYRTETGDPSAARRHVDTCSTCGGGDRDGVEAFVQRLVETGVAQPSLTVSRPSDPAEREAERVAEAVVRAPTRRRRSTDTVDSDPETCPRCGRGRPTSRPGDCPACETTDPERPVQVAGGPSRAAGSRVPAEVAARVRSVSIGGRPLPGSIRTFFESRFDRDLSDVRVHTGPRADRVARRLQASAFTVGTDVVFRAGAYRPFSSEGKQLIAHELTHVVQQGGAAQRTDGRQSPVARRTTRPVIQRSATGAAASAAAALGWCLSGAASGVLFGQLSEVVDDLLYGPEVGGSRTCQMLIDALLGCVFGTVGGAVASQLSGKLAAKTGVEVLEWLSKTLKKSTITFFMGGWARTVQKKLAACETEGRHLKSGQAIINGLRNQGALEQQPRDRQGTDPMRPSSGHVP